MRHKVIVVGRLAYPIHERLPGVKGRPDILLFCLSAFRTMVPPAKRDGPLHSGPHHLEQPAVSSCSSSSFYSFARTYGSRTALAGGAPHAG